MKNSHPFFIMPSTFQGFVLASIFILFSFDAEATIERIHEVISNFTNEMPQRAQHGHGPGPEDSDPLMQGGCEEDKQMTPLDISTGKSGSVGFNDSYTIGNRVNHKVEWGLTNIVVDTDINAFKN